MPPRFLDYTGETAKEVAVPSDLRTPPRHAPPETTWRRQNAKNLRCRRRAEPCALLISGPTSGRAQQPAAEAAVDLKLTRIPGVKARNVIFILVDDHRFDAMGFMGHPFLKTPHMDSLAKGGVYLKNAFVTTSLCSPSRATVLTGMYAHRHRVVDNNNLAAPGTIFFPQYLQQAGYQTAFIGKWHMGGQSDAPRPGFDHWVSFRGQGSYLPTRAGLNVDGKHVPQKGYITDELTDYAVDWIKGRKAEQPFFLYLSHKAVHADFVPAERHRGKYKDAVVTPPETQANTPENYRDKPMWVKNQRNSWHGVDFPYHSDLNVAEYYKRYCETLLAVDDSVGRLMDLLREQGLLESTLVMYMGDNGFLFGEHGLIDKRNAYEESMRVPLLAHCPDLFSGGTSVEKMVANMDIAPTVLAAAGLRAPESMEGRSFLELAAGKQVPWRDTLLYEYYWERNFPQTPTMHAIRTDRYKYIHYYGIWDIDELYDIQADPLEKHNLIFDEKAKATVAKLNRQMFQGLSETHGMYIPLNADRGRQQNLRRAGGSKPADFPPELIRKLGD